MGNTSPADLIQTGVDMYARGVFEGDKPPAVPLDMLYAAVIELVKLGYSNPPMLEYLVGKQFVTRLELRWRGADDPRIVAALRHAAAEVARFFPCFH
jgi:hypothetical protein